MSNWTANQLKAITLEGQNIIVSAGAGSGKTAVLTERVIRKLKNGTNINELLILTFTKAAAIEMKERIRKAIKKDPSLTFQEELLDIAYITTFDSFALSIVNRYHYILNLPPKVKIADENIIKVMKNELLEQIINELYQNKDEELIELTSTFYLKSIDEFKSSILNIYNKLEIRYDLEKYLDDYFLNFYTDKRIANDLKAYEKLIKDKVTALNRYYDSITSYFSTETQTKMDEKLIPLFSCDDYDSFCTLLQDLNLPRISKSDDPEASEKKKQLTDTLKKIKALCQYESKQVIISTIESTKGYVNLMVRILKRLYYDLNQAKNEQELFDFNDIAFKAIKIIENNTVVLEELKNSFKEILLDEYQDTNNLQDYFISLIAKNNVYMVGDVKQSIYRFRHANPSLFIQKYNDYQLNNGGYKIDLIDNFRSREEVINNVNTFFNPIMDNKLGGADYQKTHQMHFGNKTYQTNCHDTNYNYHFINYQKDDDYKNNEIEAFIIAKDIQNKIENHYMVFDKELKVMRLANYSDFTILVDRSSDFTLFNKIFEYFKIPLEVVKDDDITSSVYIKTIKNLFLLLIKYRHGENLRYDIDFKHAFISCARSFIFEMDDETIFNLVKTNNFYQNIVYETLKPLILSYEKLSLEEVITRIYHLTSIEEKLIKVENIYYNLAILEYLFNIAASLAKIGYGLEDYVNYLDSIYKNELQLVTKINKQDVYRCKIMTIHKSKGLEFPICYYPLLSPRFNLSDLKDRFVYSDKYGIITPYFKDGIGDTIYKELLKDHFYQEEISEKIRLFYVALTRCKEHMVFIVNQDDLNPSELEMGMVSYYDRLDYRRFIDLVASIYDHLNDKQVSFIDNKNLNLTKDYLNRLTKDNFLVEFGQNKDQITYYQLESKAKEVNLASYSKKVNEVLTADAIHRLQTGTKIHEVLEYIDFKNPSFFGINLPLFYQEKILKFLQSPLLNNLQNAKIYKEYQFSYQVNNEILSGVIDLIIEDEDSIKIIDYKLKHINDAEYLSQLEGYKHFMETMSQKNITCYLYSILDESFELVKV